jgi:cytochrome c oxidase subunit 2
VIVLQAPGGQPGVPGLADVLRKILFLPPAASAQARDIDSLHFSVISITMLGAFVVGTTALVFLVKYRSGPGGPRPTPRIIASPLKFEAPLWAGVLALFLIWWVMGFRLYMRMQSSPKDALEIYVTGKQWMWKFANPQGRETVGVLVVPANRPVRLLITSRDVVHSFYVPALRQKQDAVPGRFTSMAFTIDTPGSYPIYCAEYCGLSHSRMWGTVVALPPDDYDHWLQGEVPAAVAAAGGNASEEGGQLGEKGAQTMAQRGQIAAERFGCMSCHTIDGQRHIGPTWRGLYLSDVTLASGQHVIADESYITRSMMRPMDDIVAGYPPIMPTYLGQIEPGDTAAIIEFIKSLRTDTPPAPYPSLTTPGAPSPEGPPVTGAPGAPPAGLEEPVLQPVRGGGGPAEDVRPGSMEPVPPLPPKNAPKGVSPGPGRWRPQPRVEGSP